MPRSTASVHCLYDHIKAKTESISLGFYIIEGVKKNETVLIELFCFHVYNIHPFFVNYRIAK